MATAPQLQLFDMPTTVTVARDIAADPPRAAVAPTPALARRRSQAWLALHFTTLSLAAAYSARSADERARLSALPWAVIDEDRHRSVVACSAKAWEHGVRPGHPMNAAIALCAALELVPRQRNSETDLLERIASQCLTYTSAVSVQPPDEVLLEVRGSFRLFGGPAALLDRIQSDLTNLDAGVQLALAPTARSAQWLARLATKPHVCLPRDLSSALNTLPVSALRWPLPVELQLTRFGVTCLGDLMRLSRQDLGRRIGGACVRELQQALGRTAWLHAGWQTPPSYQDRVLLDFEVETTGLLEALLQRPLERLKRTLVRASRMLDELHLTLKHREGTTPLVLRLQQATADTQHLALLLHESLNRLVLRAPVREVWIEVPRLLASRAHTHTLPMEPGPARAACATDVTARLLEQLQSRFGAHGVRALALRAHHVPERAQHTHAPLTSNATIAVPARLPRRPLWLLHEPKCVDSEYRRGEFQLRSSPETLEAEAWDAAPVRRAYYRASTARGIEWWVYRELTAPHQWYLHGLFG